MAPVTWPELFAIGVFVTILIAFKSSGHSWRDVLTFATFWCFLAFVGWMLGPVHCDGDQCDEAYAVLHEPH